MKSSKSLFSNSVARVRKFPDRVQSAASKVRVREDILPPDPRSQWIQEVKSTLSPFWARRIAYR